MAQRVPQSRLTVQRWAQGLFELPNFYIIDTETTGLDNNAEVIQIGIVDKTGDTVMNTLVKPRRPVPLKATAVHHITNEMLIDAPDFFDVYFKLSSCLAGEVMIAYNMDFDWRLLQQTATLNGLPMIRPRQRDCAMRKYAAYRGESSPRRSGYRWHKLTAAARYENVQVEGVHTAVGDALMVLGLLRRMAQY